MFRPFSRASALPARRVRLRASSHIAASAPTRGAHCAAGIESCPSLKWNNCQSRTRVLRLRRALRTLALAATQGPQRNRAHVFRLRRRGVTDPRRAASPPSNPHSSTRAALSLSLAPTHARTRTSAHAHAHAHVRARAHTQRGPDPPPLSFRA